MMIWRDFFDGWDIAQSRPFDISRMFYSIAVLLIRAVSSGEACDDMAILCARMSRTAME